ncbi:hypothetical protein MTQ01_16305 [Streptomyces sp. XM4193]|uniref:hypothetical protein n=1 Tax=Streptomyces sp. XM4193 TaxID=2929782 RepID=UPI001FFC1BBC|nr:hypothetical protein [Streptomyces sp. XM4193]MCK1797560.1 hypothetical protein [Streptomyces sp. XM4193]
MRIRPIAALVSVAAVAALSTACEDPGAEADTPAKPPASDQPEQPDQPEKSEEPEQPEASETPEKEVDADLGKTLKLGETTLVTHDSGTSKTTMEVTTRTVVKGDVADLEDVRLDGKEREMVPYYVTVNYRYVDGDAPRVPSLGVTPKLRDGRGEEADRIFTTDDDVAQCVNNRPQQLAKGEDFTSCRVFLVGKSEKAANVAYQSNFREQPVVWKVED